ncbi:MAG: riboflavin synthase [Bacteroidia bacterium]
MFSGIIKDTGTIKSIEKNGTNYTYTIESKLSEQLQVDQSVAHNGVCLTVENCTENQHTVTAVQETLIKSNLNAWQKGSIINLEKCITLNSLLDGHMVQGHVDCVGKVANVVDNNGSYNITVDYDEQFAKLLIEKGSISLNGISLTVFNVTQNQFTVTIIPYTWNHTMLYTIKVGDLINLEFDVIGKYIARNLELKAQ